jgi:hypothetical protein
MAHSHNVHLDRNLKLSKMFFDDSYAEIKPVLDAMAMQYHTKQDCYIVVTQKALDGYDYDELNDGRHFCEDCIADAVASEQAKTDEKISFAIETYYSEIISKRIIRCNTCKSTFGFKYRFDDDMLFDLILKLDKYTVISPEIAWMYKILLDHPKQLPYLDFGRDASTMIGEIHVAYLKQLTHITQKLSLILSEMAVS